jgi:hypothetical protein
MKPAASPSRAGAKRRTPASAPAPAPGTLLFLTGWPACGASEFGAWLAEHRGFAHLDLQGDSSREADLREAWSRLLPADAPALVAELGARGDRWVVTAGSPAEQFPHLAALRDAGFVLWFLQPQQDGLSRQRWLAQERERDPAAKSQTWDKMADAIRKKARDLRPFFRDHCIATLTADGLIEGEAMATAIGVPAPA